CSTRSRCSTPTPASRASSCSRATGPPTARSAARPPGGAAGSRARRRTGRARPANLGGVATLYRCRTPTNVLCACGKVARRLDALGIDYDEVRVAYRKRNRPEVEDLTGQRWVPVLVHGEEVVHDSRRILEYLDYVSREEA